MNKDNDYAIGAKSLRGNKKLDTTEKISKRLRALQEEQRQITSDLKVKKRALTQALAEDTAGADDAQQIAVLENRQASIEAAISGLGALHREVERKEKIAALPQRLEERMEAFDKNIVPIIRDAFRKREQVENDLIRRRLEGEMNVQAPHKAEREKTAIDKILDLLGDVGQVKAVREKPQTGSEKESPPKVVMGKNIKKSVPGSL